MAKRQNHALEVLEFTRQELRGSIDRLAAWVDDPSKGDPEYRKTKRKEMKDHERKEKEILEAIDLIKKGAASV
jgi:hypothetical protein